MVFVQQEKERVPWYLMSNTGPTGLESPLEQENLALLLALNFTPAKSCVPKSSSCKKHFLHLCCANEETSVYEGKQISWDIYLKYKWPADGWAHHAWHPLRFCPFISLWRRQLCCLHSTFLMSFHNSHEGNICSKHQAAVLLKQPHKLMELKPCREAVLPHPNQSNPEAARLSAAQGHHHSSLKSSRGTGIMLGWWAVLNNQECREQSSSGTVGSLLILCF